MCRPLKGYLAAVREYKDTIVMFIGIAACVFVYCDFRALAATQAETAAKTAEILRTMTGGFPPWNISEEAAAVNKLLNPSVLLPLMGCVMAGVFAACGDTTAGIAAFCFPIASLVFLRMYEH